MKSSNKHNASASFSLTDVLGYHCTITFYFFKNNMKFNPCIDQCTKEGTHCEGCGRSFEEIAGTKQLVQSAIGFIKQQEYENPEVFVAAISNSILKKLQQ